MTSDVYERSIFTGFFLFALFSTLSLSMSVSCPLSLPFPLPTLVEQFFSMNKLTIDPFKIHSFDFLNYCCAFSPSEDGNLEKTLFSSYKAPAPVVANPKHWNWASVIWIEIVEIVSKWPICIILNNKCFPTSHVSAENVIYLSSLGLYLSWYLPINIQCFTTGKLLDENE